MTASIVFFSALAVRAAPLLPDRSVAAQTAMSCDPRHRLQAGRHCPGRARCCLV